VRSRAPRRLQAEDPSAAPPDSAAHGSTAFGRDHSSRSLVYAFVHLPIMKKSTQLLLALLGTLPAGAALACASCGCSINSDWSAQGISSTAGWSLDLRYDYLNQDKLWSGTHAIGAATAAAVTNTQSGAPAEIEQFTKNHYLTATLDYSNGSHWGVGLALPYIDRSHATLGVGGDGTSAGVGAYSSSGSGLGDIRVVGRYFGLTEGRNLGLQFGLKLPTGQTKQVANSDPTIDVDPGLQRGTGSTDLILGAYHFTEVAPSWSYFSQASFQHVLSSGTMAAGSYKPGDSVTLTVGARYTGLASVIPTLQVNARHAQRDSGDAADTYATGGTLVYLTLGGIVPVTDKFAPYANVQLPIYQNVNGIQLTPRYTVSVGAKYTF
jgi:hypothetical protein